MNFKVSTIALIAGLSLGGMAMAQDAPAGGPTAKGNAPLKNTHTVNDGTARQGANSFTQNEARKHILNSGYSSVSGLAKGKDGVWRGTAMKGGANFNVALDFKGNVTDGGPAGTPAANTAMPAAATNTAATTTTTTTTSTTAKDMTTATEASTMHHRHHHHWRHRHHWSHAKPCMVHGAACSGADKNADGIADKDEHKAKP